MGTEYSRACSFYIVVINLMLSKKLDIQNGKIIDAYIKKKIVLGLWT